MGLNRFENLPAIQFLTYIELGDDWVIKILIIYLIIILTIMTFWIPNI